MDSPSQKPADAAVARSWSTLRSSPIVSETRTILTEVIVNLSDAAITRVMISVDDLDRDLAFYRDVRGVPSLFAAPPMRVLFASGAVRLLATSEVALAGA